MDDAEDGSRRVSLYGQEYEVSESGSVSVTHTMSLEQARDVEATFDEAMSLQEALRLATRDALKASDRVTRKDLEPIYTDLERIRAAVEVEA